MHSPCYYDIREHDTQKLIAVRVDCSCDDFSHTAYVKDSTLGGADTDTHQKFLEHMLTQTR